MKLPLVRFNNRSAMDRDRSAIVFSNELSRRLSDKSSCSSFEIVG